MRVSSCLLYGQSRPTSERCRSQGDYAGARSLYEESLVIGRELGVRWGICTSLMGLGGVAVGMGQVERGARLLGAAEALLEAIGAVLAPDDRVVYEQGVASARAQLSEEEFDKAWAEGRGASHDYGAGHRVRALFLVSTA
jgi:serine/threonine-protein kinase PknK